MRRSWMVVTQWSFSQNSAPSALWCFFLGDGDHWKREGKKTKRRCWAEFGRGTAWYLQRKRQQVEPLSRDCNGWQNDSVKRLTQFGFQDSLRKKSIMFQFKWKNILFSHNWKSLANQTKSKNDPRGCIPLGQSVAAGCEHARPRAFLINPSETRTGSGSGSVSSQCRADEKCWLNIVGLPRQPGHQLFASLPQLLNSVWEDDGGGSQASTKKKSGPHQAAEIDFLQWGFSFSPQVKPGLASCNSPSARRTSSPRAVPAIIFSKSCCPWLVDPSSTAVSKRFRGNTCPR